MQIEVWQEVDGMGNENVIPPELEMRRATPDGKLSLVVCYTSNGQLPTPEKFASRIKAGDPPCWPQILSEIQAPLCLAVWAKDVVGEKSGWPGRKRVFLMGGGDDSTWGLQEVGHEIRTSQHDHALPRLPSLRQCGMSLFWSIVVLEIISTDSTPQDLAHVNLSLHLSKLSRRTLTGHGHAQVKRRRMLRVAEAYELERKSYPSAWSPPPVQQQPPSWQAVILPSNPPLGGWTYSLPPLPPQPSIPS